MTKRVFVAIEIDSQLKAGLDAIKERDGIAINFQVSKAIEGWLKERGIVAAKKKGGGAKKSR